MDNAVSGRRFLVVTPNVVVGEDLREVMMTYGGTEVDFFTSLDSIWQNSYDLAIFGLSIEELLVDQRVRDLRSSGTKIVILNGHFPVSALEGTFIEVLSQPFTTEDVEALIRHFDSKV